MAVAASAAYGQTRGAWLEITLNGRATDQVVLAILRGNEVLLSGEDLSTLRIQRPQAATLDQDGVPYYALDELRGLKYSIDQPRQTLLLEVPAQLFQSSTLTGSSRPAFEPTPPSSGAFLNYDIVSSRIRGVTDTNALLEANVFGAAGSGVVRFLGQDQADAKHGVRLETTWTHDSPASMSSLRLGDSITSASRWWGGAARFGGIQWGTNFATRPDLVTVPMPAVSGESVLPSTIDLYVNGALRMHRDVPAGPFTLQNVPIVTGQGDVRLVVTDALGRQQIINSAYYSSPQMLAAGLSDYSYEAGFIRDNYGLESNRYGRALAVGTYRKGLSSNLTLEAHGEWLQTQQTLGLAGALLLPADTVLSASLAGSRAASGDGQLMTLGLEHTTQRFGLGANVQWASRNFTQVGLAPGQPAPVRISQVFASAILDGLGSLSLSHTAESFRREQTVQLLSLQHGVRIGAYGYLSSSVLRVLGNRPDTIVALTLTRSFGSRTTGHMTVTSDGAGTQALAEWQKNLPVGTGSGYRVLGGAGLGSPREASFSFQNDTGTYLLEAASGTGSTGVRASAEGSVGWLAGETFASRTIDDSFAIAQVAGLRGVRIFSDNQLVARTDAHGFALVPRLRSYQENLITIDPADLPLDFNIDAGQVRAVPYARSGLLLNFPVQKNTGALLTLVLESGEPLPAGAEVKLEEAGGRSVAAKPTGAGPTGAVPTGAVPSGAVPSGPVPSGPVPSGPVPSGAAGSGAAHAQPPSFPVGFDGQVYVTGLHPEDRLRASWSGKHCELTLSYTPTADPLPRLGPYVCRSVQP